MKSIIALFVVLWICTSCGLSREEVELCRAANKGDIKAVKALLAAGANVNAKTKGGWTPLQMAAWEGHTKIVKMLIEAGAKVNAKGTEDWTALHYAVGGRHMEAVKVLIEAGANVNARLQGGKTPFDFAQSEEMELLLRKHGAKSSWELDREAKQNKAKQKNK